MRGTSRADAGLRAIEAAGLEPAPADPCRIGSVLDLVGDVAVVVWLLGSAQGTEDELAAIHGDGLEHLLERLVDTPVRGFVYEAAGSVAPERRAAGARLVERAQATWRIRAELLCAPQAPHDLWLEAAVAAATGPVNRYD